MSRVDDLQAAPSYITGSGKRSVILAEEDRDDLLAVVRAAHALTDAGPDGPEWTALCVALAAFEEGK